MNTNNLPLVTIAIITYNSSKTLGETLESIKNQSYSNLEVIISDDVSKDNTIEICENWKTENQHKFSGGIKILRNKENKGIAPNRNKCVKAASGEWIKFVDGDDLLTPDSIELFVQNLTDEMHFVMGNYYEINGQDKKKEHLINLSFFEQLSSVQLIEQEKKLNVLWPGTFHRRETWLKIGGMDERFPMLDDTPFFIKVLELGYKFYGINEFVFIYRVHSDSAQKSLGFHISHVNYINQVVVPKYKKEGKYVDYWHDKLWTKKELLKLDGKNVKAGFIKALMLVSDTKEWKYLIRDKIWRPIVFRLRK